MTDNDGSSTTSPANTSLADAARGEVSPRLPHVILASGSPRRRDILAALGISFEVRPADLDERAIAESPNPRAQVMKLAVMKADAVAEDLADIEGPALVLTADTVVVHDGEYLNKPDDVEDAHRMLGRLAGATHEVYTGICLKLTSSGDQSPPNSPGQSWVHAARSRVRLKALSEAEIEAYIATEKPLDKAGAYGAQDHSETAPLIEEIEGDYWNVVGLPVPTFLEGLDALGLSALATQTMPAPPAGIRII